MIRKKRWRYGLLGVALLTTVFPIAAQAQSGEPPAVRQDATDDAGRLEAAKDRVTVEIEKRLATLDRLTRRVESAEQVTAAHSAALLADFAAADPILTAGIEDIDAATTLAELRDIASPVFEDTLVFALLVPKTYAVVASDTIAALTHRYDDVAAKLQAELDRLAASGIDVGDPQENLNNASQIVSDVAVTTAPVAESVVGLQPGDEIKTPLAEANAALRGTRSQLHQARRLTQQVIAFIRSHSTVRSQEG